MFFSVITPTYNRKSTLARLYSSLLSQSMKDFEWIVIDDGSDDGTEELISEYAGESKIRIKYKKIAHSGKPTAHNEGVELAKGILTVCVDSDDALTPDALSLAHGLWQSHGEGSEDIIGIIAKRISFSDGKPLCSDFPRGSTSVGMTELHDRYGFCGDTALFFRSDILKAHEFPKFEGESFITESGLYAILDRFGKMLILDEGVMLCEYLPDGLTANYRRLLKENAMGTAYAYYQLFVTSRSFIWKLKYAIISESYLKISKRPSEYERRKGSLLLFLARALTPCYIRKRINKT